MFLLLLSAFSVAFIAGVLSTLKRHQQQLSKSTNGERIKKIALWIDGSLDSTAFAHNFVTFGKRRNVNIEIVKYDDASSVHFSSQTVSVFFIPNTTDYQCGLPPKSAFRLPLKSASGLPSKSAPGFVLISSTDTPLHEDPIILKWQEYFSSMDLIQVSPPISIDFLSTPRNISTFCNQLFMKGGNTFYHSSRDFIIKNEIRCE